MSTVEVKIDRISEEAYITRLRELRIIRTKAEVYIQSGFPGSLAGWLREYKDEIYRLEERLWDSGRWMRGCTENYRVVHHDGEE